MQDSAMRLALLATWLDETVFTDQEYKLTPLGGDASFRRYLRLEVEVTNYMVMDAPPAQESIKEFLEIAQFLASQGVRVPKIIAQDEANGFIVLEDFGDVLLSQKLNNETAGELYEQAMQQIVQFLQIPKESLSLPHYDHALLERELNLFNEWFLPYYDIQLSTEDEKLWQATKQTIVSAVIKQPQGFVHRDYHSRNLMILENESDFGVIDFQDAVIGAYTYDLVSIIRDVYVNWNEETVNSWLPVFYNLQKQAGINPDVDLEQFTTDFNVMGAQRHLKILGIFIRLYKRDGKAGYLPNLTQTMEYLLQELKALPALAEFNAWLCSRVLPAFIAENAEERKHLKAFIA